jgi:hypothetical protein
LHSEDNDGGCYHYFISDGVEYFSEVGDLVEIACEESVHEVRDDGGEIEYECGEVISVCEFNSRKDDNNYPTECDYIWDREDFLIHFAICGELLQYCIIQGID